MQEILVAGGSGFVGINITLKLKALGIPHVSTRFSNKAGLSGRLCTQYDFRNYQDCLEATKNKSAIILCTGYTQTIGSSKESLSSAILPSLQITAGLLEAAVRNRVKRIVLLSTSTVYQESSSPIKEADLDLNQPPFSAYFSIGWTNRYLEKIAVYYAETYDVEVVILRPTSVYGPHDKFDAARSHVIPALIRRAFDKEEPFEVWGSPDVIRDFIYVGDLVSDLISLLTGKDVPSGESINICSGKPIRVGDVAEVILNACGHRTKVVFNNDRPTSVRYRALDDTKYRIHFPHSPRTPFEAGIKATCDWYREHRDALT